jgi:hypothetical protein
MIIMKLSTLLLSSAAVLVAGAAFAADLPAKKAAPAAAPTGCSAFGAGFFAIPGGNNCISFSGRVTADQTFADPNGNRAKALDTFSSSARLNVDVRSNTDAGVVRSYTRLNGGSNGAFAVNYAYAQIGGLTAGYTDSAFIGHNNPWGWQISTDDGMVSNSVQYTASLGGTTSATVAIEDAAARKSAGLGASQVPDLVGNVKTKFGANTLQVSVATHQNHGLSSGDVQGYAFQVAGMIQASADTTVYLQAAYANAALSYLGYGSQVDAVASDASSTAKGWSVFGALNQNAGAGSISLTGVYGVQSPISGGTDVKQSQVELNYDFTGIKGMQIIPSIYYTSTDNGTTTNSTTGFLRIERDF